MEVKFLYKQTRLPKKNILIRQKNKIRLISMTLILSVLLTDTSIKAKSPFENSETISSDKKLNDDIKLLKMYKSDFLSNIYNNFTDYTDLVSNYLEHQRNKKVVALTFDDGPSQYTEALIEILNSNNVKATFFVLGCNINKYEDTLISIDQSGHEIGIHGYSHTSFNVLNVEGTQEEIDATEQIIVDLGITPSDLVRPPYGAINSEIRAAIDSTFVLWNLDTLDWKNRNKEAIIEQINESIKEGSVILLHDIYPSTIEAIEELLPLLKENYRFVTVSELNRINELEAEENYSKIKK